VNPSRHLVAGTMTVDDKVVDGVLTGGPLAVGLLAGSARRLQNGYVRSYALSLLVGALIVVLALLAVNLA
jgi:NADH-quinone oxidoreductase subunit L